MCIFCAFYTENDPLGMLKEKARYILNISKSKCLTPKIQGWPESLFGFCSQDVTLRTNFLANPVFKKYISSIVQIKNKNKKKKEFKRHARKMNELL